jgi:AmmeMemoRadiSam system protein B
MANIRQAYAAGRFYPATSQGIHKQIELLSTEQKAMAGHKEAIACLLPHAGYIYSGQAALDVLSQIEIKSTLIILGPNHTGMGEPFSIMEEGVWEMPDGWLTLNSALARRLLDTCGLLRPDTLAHQFEHSVEVELPLLQYFKKDFNFVPIVIRSSDFKSCQQLGLDIASAVKNAHVEKDVLIIASSDMTHYEEAQQAKRKDSQAIEAIEALDESVLWSRVHELDITMCGYAPATAMLSAAKALGAKRGELITYRNSGDTTGDYSTVVGYAGIIIS